MREKFIASETAERLTGPMAEPPEDQAKPLAEKPPEPLEGHIDPWKGSKAPQA